MSVPRKGLMRSLGEFVGHLWHAASKPAPPETQETETHELSRTVEEEPIETPAGSVTLRRTTIEEVVIDPPDAPLAPPGKRDNPPRA